MRENRYLRDRMIGRSRGSRGDFARGRDRERDMRNPYGSRGGYVDSARGRRDNEMSSGNQGRRMTGDYARGGRGRDRIWIIVIEKTMAIMRIMPIMKKWTMLKSMRNTKKI